MTNEELTDKLTTAVSEWMRNGDGVLSVAIKRVLDAYRPEPVRDATHDESDMKELHDVGLLVLAAERAGLSSIEVRVSDLKRVLGAAMHRPAVDTAEIVRLCEEFSRRARDAGLPGWGSRFAQIRDLVNGKGDGGDR